MDELEIIIVLVCLFTGAMLGNCAGDSATMRDCATKGETKMLSGGAIICSPKKEVAK